MYAQTIAQLGFRDFSTNGSDVSIVGLLKYALQI
jgi:hypothetical protein